MGSSLNTQKKVVSRGARVHQLHFVERNKWARMREPMMTRKTSELYKPSPTLSRAFLDLSEVSVMSEDGSPPFCDLKATTSVFIGKNDFLIVVWISAAKHSLLSNVSLCCCFVSGLSQSQ